MGQQVKVANPVKGAGVEIKSMGVRRKKKKKKKRRKENTKIGPLTKSKPKNQAQVNFSIHTHCRPNCTSPIRIGPPKNPKPN
jgi:hypothetical protein